jgi:hypothetical protein
MIIERKMLGVTPESALWRGKSALHLFIRLMRVISVHSFIRKPAFWVLMGTMMLPLNLLLAITFWVQAKIGRTGETARCARSLNVQLTYTPVFFLPIFLAGLFSSAAFRVIFPAGALITAIIGLALGVIALAGVIVLIFSNTHAFASEVHGEEAIAPARLGFVTTPVRFRFVPE